MLYKTTKNYIKQHEKRQNGVEAKNLQKFKTSKPPEILIPVPDCRLWEFYEEVMK